MAILIDQILPGMPRQMVEALAKEMDVHANPPAGLITHVAAEVPEGVRIVDVWESQADFDRFRAQLLDPSVERMMAAQGAAPQPMPPFSATEVFEIVRGR
jgi:hypothetical protein